MTVINDGNEVVAGNLSVGGDINNAALSEAITDIRKALDGYGSSFVSDGYIAPFNIEILGN